MKLFKKSTVYKDKIILLFSRRHLLGDLFPSVLKEC